MAGLVDTFVGNLRYVGRNLAVDARKARIVEFLRASWDAERGRLGLWSPVFLGAGAAGYLSLNHAPPFWLAPALLIAIAGIFFRYRDGARYLAPVALLALGSLCAQWRVMSVAAPIVQRERGIVTVEGRLIEFDESGKGRRLVIAPSKSDRIEKDEYPARIRIAWRGKEFSAKPGDVIRLRANLSPPPQPVFPGGYDFARQLYFRRIGAVGFAVTPPDVVASERKSLGARLSGAIEIFRIRLARRITQSARGDGGAIIAAVVTGKREAVSDKAEAIFRNAGLAHLLAISGLHMGLATGLIFFVLRAALALNAKIALNYPIKKWSAIAALCAGAIYLVLSGHAWSAQRAFLMSAIVFLAVIFDRRALSLRTVAIAAFIIIVVSPEAVLHPGFQMSFAAATALIAAYELYSRRQDPSRSFEWPAILRRYFIGIVITDTIAAIATAPFSLFHFSRAANFGLPANIISIPLMGFWVMPLSIIALFLWPLGLDAPLWRAAAAGVDIMLFVGAGIGRIPYAVSSISQWPVAALVALTLGGLWLCLMQSKWRFAGLTALPIASFFIAMHSAPQLFVAEDGDNAGVIVRNIKGDKTLAMYDRRKDRFSASAWMEASGIDPARSKSMRLFDFAPCDKDGCVLNLRGVRIAISEFETGLDDDCARADLVIALYPVAHFLRDDCAAPLIDRRDVWNNGAYSVFISSDAKIRIKNTRDFRGDRAWATY